MAGGTTKGGKKGAKIGRNRTKCQKYRAQGKRERHKATRIERDKRRANPMRCGHGSRHKSKYDGRCKRCYRRITEKVIA